MALIVCMHHALSLSLYYLLYGTFHFCKRTKAKTCKANCPTPYKTIIPTPRPLESIPRYHVNDEQATYSIKRCVPIAFYILV